MSNDDKNVDNNTSPQVPDPNSPEVDKISDADLEAAIHGKTVEELEAEKKSAPDSASKDNTDPLKDPADKDGADPKSDESNEQKDLTALQEELEQQKKNYAELRKKSTQDWQASAEAKKAHDELQKSFKVAIDKLNEVSTKKVDPAQFMEELQTDGLAAIEKHFNIKDKVDGALQATNDIITDLKKTVSTQSYDIEFMRRVNDGKNHPNFAELEPKMAEIAADPHCPVDRSAPIGQQLDAYYSLAVKSSSGEAVKKAHEQGKRDAEKQLAKEAKTGIASSGKGTSGEPVDLYTVPLEQLEKMLPKADRD